MLKIKDLDQLILSKLSDDDLFKFIYASKNNRYLNRICEDENFWYKKLIKKTNWKLEYPCKEVYQNSFLIDINFDIYTRDNKFIHIINSKRNDIFEEKEFFDYIINFPIDFLLKNKSIDEFYMDKINVSILISDWFKIVTNNLDELCPAKIKEFVSGDFFDVANSFLCRKDYAKKNLIIITYSDPYKSKFYLDKGLRARTNFYFC